MRFSQYENIIANKGRGGEWSRCQYVRHITKGVQHPNEGRVDRGGIAIVSLVEEYERLDLPHVDIGADLVVGGHVLVWNGCHFDTYRVHLLQCGDPVKCHCIGLTWNHQCYVLLIVGNPIDGYIDLNVRFVVQSVVPDANVYCHIVTWLNVTGELKMGNGDVMVVLPSHQPIYEINCQYAVV